MAQQFICELECAAKLDVERTMQIAKRQIADTITQAGLQMAKLLEDEIRNKVIDKIGLRDSDTYRYGEMTDLEKYIDSVDEIISRIGYSNASEIIDVCYYINKVAPYYSCVAANEKITNVDWLLSLPNEEKNGNNVGHLVNPHHYGGGGQPLDRCNSRKCNMRHYRILNEKDVVQYKRTLFSKALNEWLKTNIKDEYVINCVVQIELNVRSQKMGRIDSQDQSKQNVANWRLGNDKYYFYIKSVDIAIMTNKTNMYAIVCKKNENNLELLIDRQIVTNIKMNNICVDLCKQWRNLLFVCDEQIIEEKCNNFVYSDIELEQIFRNITSPIHGMFDHFKIMSEKIKKYWGSSGLGIHALNFEKTFDELQQVKQQLDSAKIESDVKTKEIEKLKQENEELKKQLADVEMFKKCMAMMQLQNVTQTGAVVAQVGTPM